MATVASSAPLRRMCLRPAASRLARARAWPPGTGGTAMDWLAGVEVLLLGHAFIQRLSR